MSDSNLTNLLEKQFDVQQQQLQQQKQFQLQQAQQTLQQLKEATKRKKRWYLVILALVFYIFSRYFVLKQQYKPVFDIFANSKDDSTSSLSCANQNAAPWSIVLMCSYPSISKNFINSPLTQSQAVFLYYVCRDGTIGNQKEIDTYIAQNVTIGQSVKLSPLSFFCGNVVASWIEASQGQLTIQQALQIIHDTPNQSPWGLFLTQNSKILQQPQAVWQILVTGGFYNYARASSETSAIEMYEQIFDQYNPQTNSNCSSTANGINIATNFATGIMAGASFPPYGSIVGGAAGIAVGLFGNKNMCGSFI